MGDIDLDRDFFRAVVGMTLVLLLGIIMYSADIGGVSEITEVAVTEIEKVSGVADSEMKDKDLSLVLASYPNMVNYTSNKTTKGNPNDYFIETDDGKIHYIEINRYWFRTPDLTTNDSESIKEGTILYDQYEESLAIIEGLQE